MTQVLIKPTSQKKSVQSSTELKSVYTVSTELRNVATLIRSKTDQLYRKSDVFHTNRCVWDLWNHDNTFYHLRTDPKLLIGDELYKKTQNSLRAVGRELLGCHDISPLWLSSYTQGHYQNTHRDEPHGPWAFVLALHNSKTFKGGETFINVHKKKSLEIKLSFGDLLVFNGSLPHGVREVRDAFSIPDGRLVIHGWYTSPRPFTNGTIDETDYERISEALASSGVLEEAAKLIFSKTNYICFEISFHNSGKFLDFTLKSDNLNANQKQRVRLRKKIAEFKKYLTDFKISKSHQKTILTFPVQFYD